EDGIRYKLVTGVQTCALPIFGAVNALPAIDQAGQFKLIAIRAAVDVHLETALLEQLRQRARMSKRVEVIGNWRAHAKLLLKITRSEERRVGKEGRYRRERYK